MKIVPALPISLLCLTAGYLCAAETAAERLQTSAAVLTEVMQAPDKGIPQDLLDKAQCVVIIPGMKKGAFIVGGKFGKGFFLCRRHSGVGWSAPAAVRVEGGSFGFQIGGSETDVIMLVMNQRGAQKLLSSKFTLGGDASVAAGPVGRTTSADTDLKMHAEILTYSRARGVFAGVALNGATLRPDEDTNAELYGEKLTNQQIVMGTVKAPPAAERLRAELDRYSSRKEPK
ncbi:MAG TPA: lipid-binding SYLF domain-containing protein [Bryobacteraceae bacterium]|nr:lipid-binding SYLF domain-containing protein [Bryobacteraceae bacterium]